MANRTFEADHLFHASPELVFEVIRDLTISRMETVGKATRRPKKMVGTTYEYEMIVKKRPMLAKFIITDFKRPTRFAYEVQAGLSINETIWEVERADETRSYVHYTEISRGSLAKTGWTYKLAGLLVSRKQKQATTQLFAAIYDEINKRQAQQ